MPIPVMASAMFISDLPILPVDAEKREGGSSPEINDS
jgi:hypothetical protein